MSLPDGPLDFDALCGWWFARVPEGEWPALSRDLADLVAEDPEVLGRGVAGVAELVCRSVTGTHRPERLSRATALLSAAAPLLGDVAAEALVRALGPESGRTGRRRPPGSDALRTGRAALPLVRALGRCHGAWGRALPALATLMARADLPVRRAAWESAVAHFAEGDEGARDSFLNHLYGILVERNILTSDERVAVLSHAPLYEYRLLCLRLIALGRSRPEDARVIARVLPPHYTGTMLEDGVTESAAHGETIVRLLGRLDVACPPERLTELLGDRRPEVRLAAVAALRVR